MDEFDKMDKEAGVVEAETELVPSTPSPTAVMPGGVAEYRDELVKKYHKGAASLVDRLRGDGKSTGEDLLIALIDEVLKETDNLLGNSLVATENGNLRDASVISYKRAEVLEKAFKAYQSKQQFEKESGIDLDSPSMLVIFRFFMTKVHDVFERMELPPEQRDIFFRALGEETETWKKELREEFEAMKSR
jgi:hypothetical protein